MITIMEFWALIRDIKGREFIESGHVHSPWSENSDSNTHLKVNKGEYKTVDARRGNV